MPIIDLQMRARELGRIRIGQVIEGKNGRKRPSKLDRFRITAYSRELIEKIAALYGGDVREWAPQGGGAAGWEVVTTSTRLPVLVPPQPVSQWYETWSGGGCQRRCDGVREVLSDQPCICGPDPQNRECKPTTRLNVVLREVEGVGVFRLETHGYYAAVELPSAAELLAASRGYIVGFLGLEERVVKRNGETRRFMVPTLDVAVTPTQLMSGTGGIAPALDRGEPAAIPGGERAALPAGPSATPEPAPAAEPVLDVASVRAAIAAVSDLDSLRSIWPHAKAAGLEDVAKARAAEFAAQPAPTPQPAAVTSEDPDELWAQIVRAVPQDWTSTQVESEFTNYAQVPPDQAGAADMRAYLDHLRQGNA